METETIEMLPTTIAAPAGDYELVGQADRWKQMVDGYVIDSQEMYEAGGEDLRQVKALRKKLDDERKRIKEPFLEGTRRVDAFFKRPLDMLDQAAAVINRCMVDYSAAQRRIALEAQRKAEAEAAAARKQAEAEARALAEAGKAEEAQQVMAIAEMAVAPAAPVAVPKAAGVHLRKTYSAEVTNLVELVEFVAANHKANPAVLKYLEPNLSVLNKLAVALKEDYNVPGTRAVASESAVAR